MTLCDFNHFRSILFAIADDFNGQDSTESSGRNFKAWTFMTEWLILISIKAKVDGNRRIIGIDHAWAWHTDDDADGRALSFSILTIWKQFTLKHSFRRRIFTQNPSLLGLASAARSTRYGSLIISSIIFRQKASEKRWSRLEEIQRQFSIFSAAQHETRLQKPITNRSMWNSIGD